MHNHSQSTGRLDLIAHIDRTLVALLQSGGKLRERVALASSRRTKVPISRAGARILVMLEDKACGHGELGSRVGVDQSTISRQLKELERSGLVRQESTPSDRRTRTIELTELGAKAAADLRETRNHFLSQALACFSDEEVQALDKLLSCLVEGLMVGIQAEEQKQ